MTNQVNNIKKTRLFSGNEENPSFMSLLKNKMKASSDNSARSSNANTKDNQLLMWQVRFESIRANTTIDFCLEIRDDLVLGMGDSQSQNEIFNLSDHVNGPSGVSRQHLKLSPTRTDLLMVDLNSTNGTRRNGKLIKPETPYSIHDGDILELGDLMMAVTIVKSPIQRPAVDEKTSNLIGAISHLSAAITSNLTIDDLFNRILDITQKLIFADGIALLLWNDQLNELSLRAESGIGDVKSNYSWQDDSQLNDAFRMGQSRHYKLTNDRKANSGTNYLVSTVAVAPLTFGEDSIGALVAYRGDKGAEFTADDEHLSLTNAHRRQ